MANTVFKQNLSRFAAKTQRSERASRSGGLSSLQKFTFLKPTYHVISCPGMTLGKNMCTKILFGLQDMLVCSHEILICHPKINMFTQNTYLWPWNSHKCALKTNSQLIYSYEILICTHILGNRTWKPIGSKRERMIMFALCIHPLITMTFPKLFVGKQWSLSRHPSRISAVEATWLSIVHLNASH